MPRQKAIIDTSGRTMLKPEKISDPDGFVGQKGGYGQPFCTQTRTTPCVISRYKHHVTSPFARFPNRMATITLRVREFAFSSSQQIDRECTHRPVNLTPSANLSDLHQDERFRALSLRHEATLAHRTRWVAGGGCSAFTRRHRSFKHRTCQDDSSQKPVVTVRIHMRFCL